MAAQSPPILVIGTTVLGWQQQKTLHASKQFPPRNGRSCDAAQESSLESSLIDQPRPAWLSLSRFATLMGGPCLSVYGPMKPMDS